MYLYEFVVLFFDYFYYKVLGWLLRMKINKL